MIYLKIDPSVLAELESYWAFLPCKDVGYKNDRKITHSSPSFENPRP